MKTNKYTNHFLGLIALIGFSTIATAKTQPSIADSSQFLEISGRVTPEEKSEHDVYFVELYRYNELIDTAVISVESSFSFNLKKGELYTIKVSQSGFVTKQIGISTRTFDLMSTSKKFKFNFDVALAEEPLLTEEEGKSGLPEFPVAFVYYNQKKGKFDYHKKFDDEIKQVFLSSKVYDAECPNN
jgi:hypothetical protein